LAKAHYRLAVAYDRIGLPEKAREQFQLHDEIENVAGGCCRAPAARSEAVPGSSWGAAGVSAAS